MRRSGGRNWDELREVAITPGYLDYAEGSCLITWGRTRVICAATVTEQVPPFRIHTGGGWITGEYAMLPRATHSRGERESRGKVGGGLMRSAASSAGPCGPWWTSRLWGPGR
jgi:ribonuclease PH